MVTKRIVDLVVGTVLAVLCTPIIVVLAAGVCVSLRTWRPFFVHERIGMAGRTFRILKLRTLPLCCPRYAVRLSTHLKLPRFVRFLRSSHLDEMPQVLMVPFGRLSLVGPRPKMPDEFEPVDSGYGTMRVQVPQGCTGLWQISPDSVGQPDDAPYYDSYYVENHNVRLDLWIMWRTVLLLLRLAPPTDLDSIPGWTRRRVAPVGRTAQFNLHAGMIDGPSGQ